MNELEGVAQRAQGLLSLKRHAEARSLLERALASQPDVPWLLDLLALAQLPDDAAASRKTALRLITLEPDSHRGYLLAALASIKLRRRKEERAFALRAVELAPNIASLHALHAESLAGSRLRYRKAMASARRAIELAPEDTAGYMAAGTVELLRGHKKRADGWFRQALELDPSNTAAQASLALTDRVRYRLNKAFAGAQAILQYDPTDAQARSVLNNVVYTSINNLLWIVLALAILLSILTGGR